MAEFEARFSSDAFLEVHDLQSDFQWGFSVERRHDRRRSLSAPASVGWGGRWPDAELTQSAVDFAKQFAMAAGAIDP